MIFESWLVYNQQSESFVQNFIVLLRPILYVDTNHISVVHHGQNSAMVLANKQKGHHLKGEALQ